MPNPPRPNPPQPGAGGQKDPIADEIGALVLFDAAHLCGIIAGRADQVRGPGQYITCEIAGEPILVIKGNDNVLRGFFNVCRHHAAQVVTKCEGRAENLRCPYHGWTYNLEGRLRHIPHEEGFPGFDKEAHPLVPMKASERFGLVFVTQDEPALSDDSLGGLDRLISPEQPSIAG